MTHAARLRLDRQIRLTAAVLDAMFEGWRGGPGATRDFTKRPILKPRIRDSYRRANPIVQRNAPIIGLALENKTPDTAALIPLTLCERL